MDLLGNKIEQVPTPPSPETSSGKENKSEQIVERGIGKKEAVPVAPAPVAVPTTPLSATAPTYRDRRAKLIDETLSEGLGNYFLAMTPTQQKIFKKKGEETVAKINTLLDQTKVKVNKIVSLIKKWLSLITGVNKFYLDQEAKIKADKILNLKDKL
jgi:hypothetical protein